MEPDRHWTLDDDGKPTGSTEYNRRRSEYVVAFAAPKRKRGGQSEFVFDDDARTERRANDRINAIRAEVEKWRRAPADAWGVTYETAKLLKHWRATEDRDRPLFFCQVEAVETIIWLTEVATKAGHGHLEFFRDANASANPDLFRLAMKLATGAGKTTVMAMLIAWQVINKARRPQSRSFTDAFLIVAPGITIRDRLQVLRPERPDSIYRTLQIVPHDMLDDLNRARIVVTNFQKFQLKKTLEVAKGTRDVLQGRDGDDEFDARHRETDGDMVKRVAATLMGRRDIIVINDEAHHCYEAPPKEEAQLVIRAEEETQAEAEAEAEASRKEARIWINGIRAFDRVLGVRTVFDLSATPFFLRGSGQEEGKLFPWVVSDFSLMDAIESGIVKVPRVPTYDDVVRGQEPVFRHVYKHVKLPKAGRKKGAAAALDQFPPTLEAALRALYRDYEARFHEWAAKGAETPPVFIVVANNTATSKLIHDWIAGYCDNPEEKDVTKQTWRAGNLPLFDNVVDGKPLDRRHSVLIDSHELDSGDAISDAFKAVAADEIEAFRKQLRLSPGGRDPDALTDADILRQVMNTVGRKGELGAQVRCVVSVSMLTEGWDANTVTHILGCRAFGTRLLCEQVVGRALRRVSYQPNDEGKFNPEYAEVIGVPFDFMPANSAKDFTPPKPRVRVFADTDRPAPTIKFPRVLGYRVRFPKGRLNAEFGSDSGMHIGANTIPAKTEVDPLVGEGITIETGLDEVREQRVAFMLARRALERWSNMEERDLAASPTYLFPQFLEIARRWLRDCVRLTDGRTVGYLSLAGFRDEAVNKIIAACTKTLNDAGAELILPILAPFDPEGSSRYVDMWTAKTTLLETNPAKSQINYVVYDKDWECAFAERIERIPQVLGYVKNHGLGFEVPYQFMGVEHVYRPDFIVQWDDGDPAPLNIVVEIKGWRDAQDQAKADTLQSLWLPAINNARRFGRWAAVELIEPYDMDKALEEIAARFGAAQPMMLARAA